MPALLVGLALALALFPAPQPAQAQTPASPGEGPELRFQEIDGSCGVTADGEAYCWGSDQYGRLGVADTALVDEVCESNGRTMACSTRPVRVAPGLDVAQIEGEGMRCLLTTAGETYCWGNNRTGQLGTDHERQDALRTPRPVLGDVVFEHIATGFAHGCGLTPEGRAYCWGRDQVGQGGTGTRARDVLSGGGLLPSATPVAGDTRFRQITAGRYHSCAIATDGRAHCWGMNEEGQLGRASDVRSCLMSGSQFPCGRTPEPVRGDHRFVDVAAGNDHTCALDSDGIAWCWGSNREAQLGDGEPFFGHSDGPVRVAGDTRFTALEAGDFHSCALTEEGRLYCWGWNDRRVLAMPVPSVERCSRTGEPGPGQRYGANRCFVESPTPADTDLRFRDLAANGRTMCGLGEEGRTWCWGSTEMGRLGSHAETVCDWGVNCALHPVPLARLAYDPAIRGGEPVLFVATDYDLLTAVYALLAETGYRELGARSAGDLRRRMDHYGIEGPLPVAFILVDGDDGSIDDPADFIDALRSDHPGIRILLVDATPADGVAPELEAQADGVLDVDDVQGASFIQRVRAEIDAYEAEHGEVGPNSQSSLGALVLVVVTLALLD